ncbi:MAG: hypothetical protein EA379_06745 [Phycisphaerales bacterium]|nr:MAG: hypothetical protein EA379_06745 [Phycisphaerales bacterium]
MIAANNQQDYSMLNAPIALRRFILSACIAVSAALASSVARGGGFEGVPLRVVTFNVKEGVGAPGSSSFNVIGDFLTTVTQNPGSGNTGLNPDIVALQECRSDANLLAFRDQFLPGYTYHRTNLADFGGNFNAFFVRGDLNVVHVLERFIGGPRNLLRLVIEVPGAGNLLAVYNVHFKAFGDQQSQNQRRLNAIESGIFVYNDLTLGLDLTGDNIRETPPPYGIFMGDLNSNNNFDGTITNLFTHINLGVPTGILNLPVESIGGAMSGGQPFIATFPGSNARLDYICLDNELASVFDANGDGQFSQDELNSMGFVYYSGDDQGAQSNGNASATSFASDHRPVVFDVYLPLAAQPCPGDVNGDGIVDFADLSAVLGEFGAAFDFADLSAVLANFGADCNA